MSRATLFLLAAAAGCATTVQSEFKPDGYEMREPGRATNKSPGAAYRIDYVDRARRAIMPGDWRIIGHAMQDGAPTHALEKGDNIVEISWPDRDGAPRTFTALAYDLRLSHDGSNGAVGARLMPMDRAERGRSARVLVEAWVNRLNGTVTEPGLFRWTIVSRRMATRVIDSTEVKVGGATAHAVTFESVDADQLQLDPNAPRVKGRAVLVEQLVYKRLDGLGARPDLAVPARLLLLYVNDAPSFSSQLPAFEALLARVHVGGS